MLLTLLFSLLILNFQYSNGADVHYYWKDFDDSIVPRDAYKAGKDALGNYFYIGTAFVRTHGMSVVQIYPGHPEIYAPMYEVTRVGRNIQILCVTDPCHFHWLNTTAATYKKLVAGKHIPTGGYDDTYGNNVKYNIGRVFDQGAYKIGNVGAYRSDTDPWMGINSEKKVKYMDTWQVLVYSDKQCGVLDIDVRIDDN